MKKYLLTTLTLGLIASNLNADCVKKTVGGLCEYVKIDRLFVTSTETNIGTSGDESIFTVANDGCNAKAGIYLSLKKSNRNYEVMHETIRSAQLQDKKVWIRVAPDAADNCEVVYVVVDYK